MHQQYIEKCMLKLNHPDQQTNWAQKTNNQQSLVQLKSPQ